MTDGPPYDTSAAGTESDDEAAPGSGDRLYESVNRHGLARLEDRTAVVTGSTRGIGEGIARRFASEGANVVVSGRSVDSGEAVAEAIRDAGGSATFVSADMADPEEIRNLVEETVDTYGGLDILVNNAATWRHGSFEERDLADWELVTNVSLRAPWLATKYAMEHFPAGGRVINVSSIHALATDPGRFPYNALKSGLDGMTRSLAIELGPLDVTVNGIRPGRVQIQDPVDVEGDAVDRYARLTPANRCGVPEDIAALAAFLASRESGFITGENVTADGGWTTCLLDDLGAYDDHE